MPSKLVMLAFLVVVSASLAACYPAHYDYFEAASSEGSSFGGICSGAGGPPTSVRVMRDGLTIWIRETSVEGSNVGSSDFKPGLWLQIIVPRDKIAYIDWSQLRLADAITGVSGLNGQVEVRAVTRLFRPGSPGQSVGSPLDRPLDGNAGTSVYRDSTEFDIELPLMQLSQEFYLEFPGMSVGQESYKPFRVDFRKTSGWSFTPVNC